MHERFTLACPILRFQCHLWACPSPFEAGRQDKRRIISESHHPAGHTSCIPGFFKTAALMPSGETTSIMGKFVLPLRCHFDTVFKTSCPLFFFLAILLWHSGSLRDVGAFTKCIVGLWEPGIWCYDGCYLRFQHPDTASCLRNQLTGEQDTDT